MPNILPLVFPALPTPTQLEPQPEPTPVYTGRPRGSPSSNVGFDINSNFASAPLPFLPRSASKRALSIAEMKRAVRVIDEEEEREVEANTKASTSFDSMEESDPATPTPANLHGKATTFEDRIPALTPTSLPDSPPLTPDRPSASVDESGSTVIPSAVAFPKIRTKRVRGQRREGSPTGGDSGSEEDLPMGENVIRTPGAGTPPVVNITSPTSPALETSPVSTTPCLLGLIDHQPIQAGKAGTLRLNLEAIKRSYSEPHAVVASKAASVTSSNGDSMIRKKSGEVVRSSMKSCRSLSGMSSGATTPFYGSTPAQSGPNSPINSPTRETIDLPLSLPPTPTRFVRFNYELEHVKVFTAEEKPAVISRTGSPINSDDDEDSDAVHIKRYGYPSYNGGYSSEDETKKPRGIKVTNNADVLITPSTRTGPARGGFRTPPHGGPQQEWGIMTGRDLKLESLTLANDGRTITGGVIARNLAFNKWIAVRFTVDGWQTTSEVTAKYSGDASPRCRCSQCPPWSGDNSAPSIPSPPVSSTCPGFVEPDLTIGHYEHFDFRPHQYDRFTFTIKLSDIALAKIAEKTIMMAVRYHVSGREIWDNNDGQNYRMEFLRASSSPALLPSLSIASAAASTTGLQLKKKKAVRKKEEFVNTGAAPTYISTGPADRRTASLNSLTGPSRPTGIKSRPQRDGSGDDDEDEANDPLVRLKLRTKPTFLTSSPMGSPVASQARLPTATTTLLTRPPLASTHSSSRSTSSSHQRHATVPAISSPPPASAMLWGHQSPPATTAGSPGWSGDLRKQLEKVADDEKHSSRSKVRDWMRHTTVVMDSDEDDDDSMLTRRPRLRSPSGSSTGKKDDAPQAFQSSSLKTRYDFGAAWKGASTWSPISEHAAAAVPVNKSFPQGAAATSNPFYGPGNHGGSAFPSPTSPAKRVFASSAGGHVYPGNSSPSSWPSFAAYGAGETSTPPASSPTRGPGANLTNRESLTPKSMAASTNNSTPKAKAGSTSPKVSPSSSKPSLSPGGNNKPSMSFSPPLASTRHYRAAPLPQGSPRDVDDINRDHSHSPAMSSPKFSLDPERDYGRRSSSRERGSYFDVWAAITNPGSHRTMSAPSVPSPSALAAGNPMPSVSEDASTDAVRVSEAEAEAESDSGSSSSSSSDVTAMDAHHLPSASEQAVAAAAYSPSNSSLASTPSVTSASSPSQSPSSPMELLPSVNSLEEAGAGMGTFLNRWCYYTGVGGDRTTGRAAGSDEDAIVHRRTQSASDVDQYFATSSSSPFHSPPLPDFYGISARSEADINSRSAPNAGIMDALGSGDSTPTRTYVGARRQDTVASPEKGVLTPRPGTPALIRASS